MSAADYVDLLAARRDWIARMQSALQGIDALLSPTVPIVAAPIAPLREDDAAFFAANALLLRNPSMVNLLDGCALTHPVPRRRRAAGRPHDLDAALHDDAVLDAGLAIEAALGGAAAAAARR